jgi:hypothetical protein
MRRATETGVKNVLHLHPQPGSGTGRDHPSSCLFRRHTEVGRGLEGIMAPEQNSNLLTDTIALYYCRTKPSTALLYNEAIESLPRNAINLQKTTK